MIYITTNAIVTQQRGLSTRVSNCTGYTAWNELRKWPLVE
jgi:hypothetical protein